MKRSVVLMLFLGWAASLAADDGSWTEDAGYLSSGGALYSEKSSIALEKEYLELTDAEGNVRAVFLFRNTDAQPVEVEAAFPIEVRFEAQPVGLGAGPAFDVDPSLQPLLAALGVPASAWEPEDEDGHSTYHGTAFAASDYPKGRREYPAGALAALFSIAVKQDGAVLPFSSCVADFGKAPGVVTLHFRHRLKFASGAAGRVEVGYVQPLFLGSDHEPTALPPHTTTRYRWNYVLETAASWKGPLGELVLSVPEQAADTLPKPWQDLGARNGRRYFVARDWEPGPGSNLALGWEEREEDTAYPWENEIETEEPAPPSGGARFLSASSFIPDRADAYLATGIWKNAPFDGRRLFDGLPETAWAVRTKTGGVGEAVRFSLEAKQFGLTVYNGYQRSSVDYPPKKTWSFFERNNRVKTLDLIRERDGLLIRRLALSDGREGQPFPVTLEPGTYRFVIVEVYPGTQWNDTCLGEVVFSPAPWAAVPDPAALKALSGQDFFRDYLVP